MWTRAAGAVLVLWSFAAAGVFDGLAIYNPVYSRTATLVDTNGQTVNSWRC